MNENNDYRPENEGYSNPDNLYLYPIPAPL